jgi:hypothetical protein
VVGSTAIIKELLGLANSSPAIVVIGVGGGDGEVGIAKVGCGVSVGVS